jgi:hypothetical protein
VLQRHGRFADHGVDFFLQFAVRLRVFEKRVKEEREQS